LLGLKKVSPIVLEDLEQTARLANPLPSDPLG
jgi:hypothetical protein